MAADQATAGAKPDSLGISVTNVSDPEKTPCAAGAPPDGRFGDQIDEELMAELAPNGEGDYIRDCVNGMSEAEARDIVADGLAFHKDDWNFPKEMRTRMQRLIDEGAEGYGPLYGRDLRVDAVMLRYSSPYPGVRSVTDPVDTDGDDVPVETIRAYVLGIGWAVVGTFVSTFFNSRFPAIGLSGSVIQILLFPCAKFLERVLPDWGLTVWGGTRHSLNPGAWTFKEQMFATITFNVAIYTTNAYGMILVQHMPVYYGEAFVGVGYQLMLTLFVQLMGMGFAGYLRRFSVYPVKAMWPTVLPVIAMNRALTRPDDKDGKNNKYVTAAYGWTISRYRFFLYSAGAMFVYYWLPGYLFTALSTLNWMTWIAPDNLTLAILTGSQLGLGLFNPLTTLDWNVATSSYAALAQPFFSTATMYVGSLLGGLVILAIYYTNLYHTAYLPINSSSAFTNNGSVFAVQNVIAVNKNNSTRTLDEARYQAYSPPFYTAGYILTVGGNFAFYPVYFLYVMGDQWRTISRAYVDFYRGLRYGAGNYDGATDVHNRGMARFKEVPDWWFLALLAVAVAVAIVFLHIYPLGTPVWLVFLLLGINLVFAVPLSLLSATTGTNLGLGSLIEVVTGYMVPGRPNAFLFAQTLGSWALAGYGDNYVQDNKMAHYVKIAPRAVFRSQITTIIITCFVAVATQNLVMDHVPGLCTPNQPSHFTCAADGNPLYASSLMWGLLGSDRMFGALYPFFKWCFLIGFGIAVVFLVCQNRGPVYLPRVRRWLQRQRWLPARVFALLDRTLFDAVARSLWLNPVLLLQGIQHWAPSNMAYKTPGFLLSYIFMYWLQKHRLSWWERYNYTLSAALTAGVAISALVMFFAVGYHPAPLKWWGNTVSTAGVDAKLVGIRPLPERGYFGPEPGHFP